jgi:hypothetical protein
MSQDTLRVWILGIVIIVAIAFLAITADLMSRYPQVPWFGFGVLATIVLEGIIYGIYCLVKHLRD